MPRKTFTRFWSQVDVRGMAECWSYRGGLDSDGYGIFSGPGRVSVRAHRFAYRLAEGCYARPMTLHRCGNRACCNPMHLYEGTAQDNINDCIADGNYVTVFVPGEQHANAKLTNSQIAWALNQLAMGVEQRVIAKRLGVTTGAIYYHKRKRDHA